MKYAREEEDIVTLCSFGELTYRQRMMLLDGLKRSSPDFAGAADCLIKSLSCGVYNKVRELFYDGAYRAGVLRGLEKKGVQCVTYFSSAYPEPLRQIACPPLMLYAKGDLSLLNERLFAVVGSRRTLPNMLRTCREVSEGLTERFAVVSGMADGADAAALEGALAGGRAISVLAHGFDYVYPAVHAELTRRIARSGLLLSEFAPDVPPRGYQFPVRNRIIAGLAEAALIVSAGKKSGALITAEYALEYGRTVFAFPYTVGVTSGEGCNSLLKNGGVLVENLLDIFSVLGLDCKPPRPAELTQEEEALYSLIAQQGEAAVSAAAEALGTEPYLLIPLISSLEIKGLIARVGGNRYAVTGKARG